MTRVRRQSSGDSWSRIRRYGPFMTFPVRHFSLGAPGLLLTALLAGTAFAQQSTPQPVIHTVGQLYDLIEAQRDDLRREIIAARESEARLTCLPPGRAGGLTQILARAGT